MTVKEASCSGPEPPATRHTYSPESAGETWGSRSREPWVCGSEEGTAITPKSWGPGESPSPWGQWPSPPLRPRSSGLQLGVTRELHLPDPPCPTGLLYGGGSCLGDNSAAGPEHSGPSSAKQLCSQSMPSPGLRMFAVQKANAGRTLPALERSPSGPCTWCRAGRLPPRLYHVTWAWACPGTTQFKSRVCPSATWEEEASM